MRQHERPPDGQLIQQLADTLDMDADYLFFLAGRVPSDLLELPTDPAVKVRAVKTLRRTLESRRCAYLMFRVGEISIGPWVG